MLVKLFFIFCSTKLVLAKPFLDYFQEKSVVHSNYLNEILQDDSISRSSYPLGNIAQDQAVEKCARRCVLDTATCFYFAVKQKNEKLSCEAFGKNFPFPVKPSTSRASSITIYKMSQEPAILNAYFRENIASKSLEELTDFLSERFGNFGVKVMTSIRSKRYGNLWLAWKDYTSFVSTFLSRSMDAILHSRIPQVALFDTFTPVTRIKSHPISKAEIETRKTLFNEALVKGSFPCQPFILDFIQIFCHQGGLRTVYDQNDGLLFIYGSNKEECFLIKVVGNNRFIVVQQNEKWGMPMSVTKPLKDWNIEVAVESYLLAMEQAGMKTTPSETRVIFLDHPEDSPFMLISFVMGYFIPEFSSLNVEDYRGIVLTTMKAMLYTAYAQSINTALYKSRLYQSQNQFSDLDIIG